MAAHSPRLFFAVLAGVLLALSPHAGDAQETNEIPPLDFSSVAAASPPDPTDLVMEGANRALVRVFSNSDAVARYFVDTINWLAGRLVKLLVGLVYSPTPAGQEVVRPVRETMFFTPRGGSGGPRERLREGLGGVCNVLALHLAFSFSVFLCAMLHFILY